MNQGYCLPWLFSDMNKRVGLTMRKKSNFCVALHPSSLQRTVSTPHSSGFARLEFGAFYFAIELRLFTRSSGFDREINQTSRKTPTRAYHPTYWGDRR